LSVLKKESSENAKQRADYFLILRTLAFSDVTGSQEAAAAGKRLGWVE